MVDKKVSQILLNASYEQIKKLLGKEGIKGIMGSVAQREFMFNLAKCSEIGAEIGTYQGYSAVIVGLGMRGRLGCKHYCVDTYKSSNEVWKKKGIYGVSTLEIFLKHCKQLKLEDVLVPIIGNSQDQKIIDSVPNNLDFIYIDGSHETDDVYLDIINWVPKVKKDGLILFHDYSWLLIKKAVERATNEGIIYRYVSWDDFGICKKGKK